MSIEILKPALNVVGKMQTGEGELEGSRLMQCYRMREGGTLLSYTRPCTADESKVNVTGKLDIRSESRERAFDHHDMLNT